MPLTMILLNSLLGALCGFWFRVQVLFCLSVLALMEVALIGWIGTGRSVYWVGLAILFSVQVGYVIGSLLAAYSAPVGAITSWGTLYRWAHNRWIDRRLSHQ
jgi:hypothetical protein